MIMNKATRPQVKRFGEELGRGDTLVNRYKEHGWMGGERELTVLHDVPGRAFFILKDQDGKVTWMRTRTLLERYVRITTRS
jgi:hypothetical protein